MTGTRLPFSRPIPLAPFLVWTGCAVLFSGALQLWPDALLALRYERGALWQGQWWRLFTGHLIHVHSQHWVLNALTGLLLAWVLHPWLRQASWPRLVGIAMLGVSAGLWWHAPSVAWYAGWSGVWHAVFAYACVNGYALGGMHRAWAFGALAVGLGKLAWESASGPMAPHPWLSMQVVYAAHGYGLITGLAYGVVQVSWRHLHDGGSNRTQG